VHRLANKKNFDNIKMHSTYVENKCSEVVTTLSLQNFDFLVW